MKTEHIYEALTGNVIPLGRLQSWFLLVDDMVSFEQPLACYKGWVTVLGYICPYLKAYHPYD